MFKKGYRSNIDPGWGVGDLGEEKYLKAKDKNFEWEERQYEKFPAARR